LGEAIERTDKLIYGFLVFGAVETQDFASVRPRRFCVCTTPKILRLYDPEDFASTTPNNHHIPALPNNDVADRY